MKDKLFILSLDLENINTSQVKEKLISNGWFFKYINVGAQIRINVYLLEEDYDFFHEEPFYTVKGKNKDDAFYTFLRDTKEKYKL